MDGGTIDRKTRAEATANPSTSTFEDALKNALENIFPAVESTNDARTEFYNKFTHEAEGYDKEFRDKYGGDLDITLIFAALFSAVVSAFIIPIQAQLQPDYTQLSYDLLWMTANATGMNPPPKPSSDSPWTGPDPKLAHIQAILYSSLAASLLAAFVAMLGKQWLNRYFQVDMRGSLIDRSRDRQRKADGMATWRFKFVMESLPLMLQASLLLLGCALSKYLFTIDNLIAWVVVGFTTAGFLFYLIIIFAATLSYDCPFQTPPSLIIRFIICLYQDRRKYLDKTSIWLHHMLHRKRGQGRRGPRRVTGPDGPDGNNGMEHHELPAAPPPIPPVLFDLGTDRNGYVLDAKCIAWMFEMSMDPEVILDITKFIPEIIWHNGIQTTPLEKLYDILLECFDHSSGKPVVASKFRDRAYFSAKALLHLAVQRKCTGDDSDAGVFHYISDRHAENLGSRHFKGDPDLDSTLGMIDRVFLDRIEHEAMDWHQLSLTDPHRTWMSRILLSLAWDAIGKGQPLPTDVQAFVRHSLGLVPPPPAQTVRDCLYVVELILKTSLEDDKPHAIDIGPQIVRIYQNLLGTFQKNNPTPTEIDRALEAMSLISPLSNQEVAAKSFELFYVIMRAPVPSAYSGNAWEAKKWEASRLALHGAYKWDGALPEVEDPQAILNFLCHHFELALVKNGKPQDEPIQDALHALAYASTSKAIETIEEFDPTRPSFVHGICFSFQDKRSSELHRAALFFLRLIAKNWFSAPGTIMTPEITKSLCVDWASAVDEFHSDPHVQNVALEVLLDMMNSSHWCPHIVPKKWRLLERFIPAVPSGVEPLERCLGNVGLIGEISKMKNPEAMTLWSTILWLKYAELEREVQRKLESVTSAPDEYLLVVESEYAKAEEESLRYNTWSKEPAAVALKKKMDKLREASDRLEYLKGSSSRR